MSTLPAGVQSYLLSASVAVSESLVISVDNDWNYLSHQGDLARFALQDTPLDELSALLKALCMGLSRVRGSELKHVGLPNGRFVDLHLFSSKDAVHILFLDVRSEVEKTRVWQQSAQETELKSYEKTRELRKKTSSLASVREQRDQLAWALALSWARRSAVRHELFVVSDNCAVQIAGAFERAELSAPLTYQKAPCTLEQIAVVLEKIAIAQISLSRNAADQRPIHADPQGCASAVLPLLMFAHRRAGTSTPLLSAHLKLEREALILTVHCGMQELSSAESVLLWQRRFTSLKLQQGASVDKSMFSPSDLALVLCAERIAQMGARITRQFETGAGLNMVMSIPLPQLHRAVEPIDRLLEQKPPQTRVALAVGAKCLLLSADNRMAHIAGTAVEPRGLVLEVSAQLEGVLEMIRAQASHPGMAASVAPVLLIDPELSGASKFAFSARGAGYKGLIVALQPFESGKAIQSAFDYICERPAASEVQLALFGSAGAPKLPGDS